MVYLSVDEYMLNTLLYSVYQNNQLELKLTSRQMKLSSVFGRTITARELVRFIRPLQRYGSAPLQFGLDASSAPKAQITSSGVTVTGTFTLYVNVEKPDGSTEQVFRFTVRVNASLKPKIDDNRIKADVTRFTATGVDRRGFPQSFIDTTGMLSLRDNVIQLLENLAIVDMPALQNLMTILQFMSYVSLFQT
ncbi:unnamed protein product [Clavelina lepadiformis]|uniref:Lipid-binding serum glycoprotein C-terminal domain-containing protein n=1 Tax=Clavelina lepadiformis TaxID=159417 RepID=A0ABP0FRH5_CLALP